MTEAIEQIQRTASLLVPEIILLATVCILFLAGPLAVSDAGEAALQERDVDDSRLYYALSAAMLGHLAMRQPDRTLQLWRERPDPLQRFAATPDIELVLRVAEKRLADGVLVSQGPAAP